MRTPYPHDEDEELPRIEDDFDTWFEAYQSGVEDTHVQQALARLDAEGRRIIAKNAPSDEAGAANADPRP